VRKRLIFEEEPLTPKKISMSESEKLRSSSADEVVLRDILREAGIWWCEIRRHYKLALGILLGTVLLLLAIAFFSVKQYEAKVTFMVNEDEGSKLGGISGLLESVGFGGVAGSDFNLDKIMALAHSRRVICRALLDSAEVEGEADLLANHLIRIYRLQERWSRKKPKLKGFVFRSDSLEHFNLLEHTALNEVYKYVEKGEGRVDPLLSTSMAPEAGIMSLTVTARSQEFSRALALALFNSLSNFYIEKTAEKQRTTYEQMKMQADSIGRALRAKEYELAKFMDMHQNLIPQTAQLKKERLEREVFILNTMYGEAVQNKELAHFTLKSKTPFVQPVDVPILPLKVIQMSKAKSLVFGLFLGALLAVVFIIGRMKVRRALAEE